jgi:hypothetical protein
LYSLLVPAPQAALHEVDTSVSALEADKFALEVDIAASALQAGKLAWEVDTSALELEAGNFAA